MPEDSTEAVPTQPAREEILAHRPLQPDDPREIGGYRLRARLGEGGMGRVYLSYTPGGRPVAIKVIRAEFADDPGFRRRFEQEVATAQRVHGLYTAPVIDANTEGAQPWLATAYVPGPSLQQAVGVYGPLPEESVLVLVAGVAEALQSIHAAGIVHRDLKPSNVILAADGPRVIDFGIARAVDTTSATQTGLRVGTPAFMAPEQVRGKSVTPAVDVFALGALACYAATGELPFGGGLDPLVPHRILEEEPDLAACPQRVKDLATRCLAKDPRQRPSPTQVIELCRELSTGTRLQMGQDWLPPSVAAAVQRIATAPVPPAPAEAGQSAARRRRLVALAVAGMVAVAAAAGITAAALSGAFRPTATGGSAQPGPATSGNRESSFPTEPTVTSTTHGAVSSAPTTATSPSEPRPQVINTAEASNKGTVAVRDGDWVDLETGVAGSVSGDSDFRVNNDVNAGEIVLLGGTPYLAAFADIDGEVSKQSCFARLRSRQDNRVELSPKSVGRWTCVQTSDKRTAAVKADRVDLVAGTADLAYVVWE